MNGLKNIFDSDKDGKISWSTELRPLFYFFLICYMVVMEGLSVGETYSETWIIFISVGTIGVEAVVALLKVKSINKTHRDNPEIPEIPE